MVAKQQHTEKQPKTTGNWNSRQTTELLVSLSLEMVAKQQHTEQQLETTGNWNSRQTTELLVSFSLENGS